jgi:hypothetical protein
MRHRWLALALLVLLRPAAAQPADLYRAMEASDTEAVGHAVAAVLRDAGAHLPPDLRWALQRFDAPVNSYEVSERTVHLSRIPTPPQAAAYWAAWSGLLTEGRWRPDAFFRDDAEAHRLAAFNQAVLAAHELGHALAYHYAVNPAFPDGNVNCQELMADRVAAGAVHTLAAADPRFAVLRARYVALIADLQAHIAPHLRVDAADPDDCDALRVELPGTVPVFIRYASAYFARQTALLGPPHAAPLPDVLRAHITDAFDAYRARVPAVPAAGPVRTLGETALLASEPFDDASDVELAVMLGADEPRHAAAFGADGLPVGLSLGPTAGDAPRLRLHAAQGDTRARHLAAAPASGLLLVQQAAVDADGALVALVLHADGDRPLRAHLLRVPVATKQPARVGPPLDLPAGTDAAALRLVAAPDGALAVVLPGRRWPVRADLSLGAEARDTSPWPGEPLALDARGRLVAADREAVGRLLPAGGEMWRMPGGSVLLRAGADGRAERVAGTGFDAAVDGPVHDASLRRVRALRADGCALRWLESDRPTDPLVLRASVSSGCDSP